MGKSVMKALMFGGLFGSGDKKKSPEAAPTPQPPQVDSGAMEKDAAATAAAATKSKRKAIRRNKSIFTSPLGVAGEAQTVKKTLLGQ